MRAFETTAEIKLTPSTTYATRENARKAVEKFIGRAGAFVDSYRYVIVQLEDGRYTPLFIGQQSLQPFIWSRFPVTA